MLLYWKLHLLLDWVLHLLGWILNLLDGILRLLCSNRNLLLLTGLLGNLSIR